MSQSQFLRGSYQNSVVCRCLALHKQTLCCLFNSALECASPLTVTGKIL